jgi:hypothetical protein
VANSYCRGGFGGLRAAQALNSELVDVTLVDRRIRSRAAKPLHQPRQVFGEFSKIVKIRRRSYYTSGHSPSSQSGDPRILANPSKWAS